MTTNRSIALVVEGVGSDATYANGIAWYYGRRTIGTANGYEWIGGSGSGQGLVKPPDSVAATVDPFTCSLRDAEFRFELHADTTAKLQWIPRPYTPADTLSAAIDTDATTVVFSGTWTASSDGTVVWIGDEAILLGTHTAGGTFTGCTREYYGTSALYLPAGANVYQSNTRRELRQCKVITYDHDAGTVSQAWQGFVKDFYADNGKIHISAQGVISATSGAMVNRGMTYINTTRQRLPALGEPMRARFDLTRRDYSAGKRVNKANATSPHWVGLRVGGALVYANFSSATNNAVLSDEGSGYAAGSLPAMGSHWDPEDMSDRNRFELLVVDRMRDVGATGTAVSYANMRSSSRDLQYPFHPVAISMALLTSGPSPDPGQPGTGAAGSSPTSFGDTVTYITKAQYYTGASTASAIRGMDAKGLTSKVFISADDNDAGTQYLPKMVPVDGGAALWTMDDTGVSTTAGRAGGVATDPNGGSLCWALFDGDTTGSDAMLVGLDVSDGTQDWSLVFPAATSGPHSWDCITYIPGLDKVVVGVLDAGDEIVVVNATTGIEDGNTSDTYTTDLAAVGYCTDESYLLAIGTSVEIECWDLPFTPESAPDATIDLKTGTDTTLTWAAFASGTDASAAVVQIEPDRVGTGAWFCGGDMNSQDYPYLMHFDPNGGTPQIDIEIDVSGDAGITMGSADQVPDLCVDKYGDVWVLIGNGNSARDTDILRYSSAGTFKQSLKDDGLTLPVAADTEDGLSLAITEDGYLALGTSTGYVWIYQVTT